VRTSVWMSGVLGKEPASAVVRALG
jgi:hypothetical protein